MYEWAGAVLTPGRSCDGQKSVFQSISRHQNFHVTDTQTFRHSDQGTHPLIESLRQRLKKDYMLNTAKVIKEFYTHLLSSLDIGTVLYFGLSHFNDLMAHSCF